MFAPSNSPALATEVADVLLELAGDKPSEEAATDESERDVLADDGVVVAGPYQYGRPRPSEGGYSCCCWCWWLLSPVVVPVVVPEEEGGTAPVEVDKGVPGGEGAA